VYNPPSNTAVQRQQHNSSTSSAAEAQQQRCRSSSNRTTVPAAAKVAAEQYQQSKSNCNSITSIVAKAFMLVFRPCSSMLRPATNKTSHNNIKGDINSSTTSSVKAIRFTYNSST